MREIWFSLLGILSLLLVSTGSPEAAAPHLMLADAQTVLQISKDDRILGNPEAPITIVEYASLTCPHCAHLRTMSFPGSRRSGSTPGKPNWCCVTIPSTNPLCAPR